MIDKKNTKIIKKKTGTVICTVFDFTIIQYGNDQNHEWRKVELPYECNEHETELQKDGN